VTKDHGFVAPCFDRPRLRQRLGLHNISLDIPSGSGQAHTYRIGRKHLRMPVTDPHGGIERDAHVVQSEVKLAGVNPAMPHHDAVRHCNPRQVMRLTAIDTTGKVGKPIIAVVNSFTQFVPGHVHLKDLGQLVALTSAWGSSVAGEFAARADVVIGEQGHFR
jgi:hypothetical protein